MKDTQRNIHCKFGSNWSNSARRRILKAVTLKTAKKTKKIKKGNNSNMA